MKDLLIQNNLSSSMYFICPICVICGEIFMDKHFIIISYDIPETKRRTKIHKALKAYGEWVQYSIFECNLTKTEFAKLRARLNPLIDPDEDSIRFYFVCESCKIKVERIGGGTPRDETIFMV